jgi:hypothetical protein
MIIYYIWMDDLFIKLNVFNMLDGWTVTDGLFYKYPKKYIFKNFNIYN